MRFEPKTEKQLAEEGMLPADTICDFEVVEAKDTTSKAGNEMIALQLKVWRPNGSTMLMRDWLVSNMQGKVLGFAKSVGMRAAYDAGEFHAEDLVGKCGKVKLGIEPAQGDYPARNRVASYVNGEGRAQPPKPGTRGGGKSPADLDEIPFSPETRA